MFISGPGFRRIKDAGAERLISNIDLARTMIEVATGDDDYPFRTDGISFLPVLKDKPVTSINLLPTDTDAAVLVLLLLLHPA